MTQAQHTNFSGHIPAVYDRHLGPVLFEPFARDLARRMPETKGVRVLETACGTGIVTRHLLDRLPGSARVVATDLNPGMLEHARQAIGPDSRLELRAADAQALPFDAGSFDVVAMQFGLMFVPDKLLALREAHRVLAADGLLLFLNWDSFEANGFGRITHDVLMSVFPEDPPTFYLTPFGDHDPAELVARTQAAGFRDVTIEGVAFEGTSESADSLATGLIRGNPVSIAISERGTVTHDAIVRRLAEAFRREFGDVPARVPLRAWLVTATA